MRMRRFILSVCLLSVALFASAEISDILGNWKTVDDKTGNSYSVVSIYRGTDGLYYGKIAKMLMGPADLVCDKCPGDDHNAPLVGLVFIRGMKYDAKNNQLVGGKLLDPESGNFYYSRINTLNKQQYIWQIFKN